MYEFCCEEENSRYVKGDMNSYSYIIMAAVMQLYMCAGISFFFIYSFRYIDTFLFLSLLLLLLHIFELEQNLRSYINLVFLFFFFSSSSS